MYIFKGVRMKYLILLCAMACNQQIFDQLYLQVKTINFGIEIEKLDRMNKHFQYDVEYEEPVPVNFNIIRDLCGGQKSKYEKN